MSAEAKALPTAGPGSIDAKAPKAPPPLPSVPIADEIESVIPLNPPPPPPPKGVRLNSQVQPECLLLNFYPPYVFNQSPAAVLDDGIPLNKLLIP